jgi:hypothetical protein
MSAEEAKEERRKQRRHSIHQANLQSAQQQDSETAQILNTLSEIEDLPISPEDDPVMGQLVSKLTSTSNLSSEEVRSDEWVREYILILYLCKYPTPDGMHSSWRGWAHGDKSEAREPLQPEKRAELEAFVNMSKLALKRSEDAKVIEEGARNVNESVMTNPEQESGGGGLLAKIGLR